MNENGGCLLRIREALHALTPKEQHLANFLLLQPERAVDMPIDDLAATCGVSISTVIRLCKSLGYTGYKELCRNLYSDLTAPAQAESSFEDIHPGDSPEIVMRNIFMSSIKAIENTFAIMDVPALEAAVDRLCAARRIDFYGLGTSGFVALDACNKFQRCNKLAIAHSDPHGQLLSALTLTPEDVAVLISYSGDTTDMLSLARHIREQGTTIISLTRYGKNPLSEMADIRLYSSSTETLLRSGAMSSRIAQLAVIDTLYTAVCSRIFDEVKPHLEKTRVATMRLHQSGEKEK